MRDDIGLRLLRDGYAALARLRDARGGDSWYEATMLGRRALVVRGEEGVRLFYDEDVVSRSGAVPAPLRLLLFGPGAVHGLDGEQHRSRKQVFLQIVDRPAVERLADDVAVRLGDASREWVARGRADLFDELVRAYGDAVLSWAGIEVPDDQAAAVTRDLAAMVDSFGPGGTSYARGYAARVRGTRWARAVVREARAGRRHPPADSALARIAARGDLGPTVAGVELLNVLRPTVAVAYFGAYAAHALAHHPAWRERLRGPDPDPGVLRAFGHEVRRVYPFTPLLAGRLARDLTWAGRRFPRRSWIVLDVLGTDLDPQHWDDVDAFRPERFVGREPNPFEYVPHGGGDPATGHRCPGEPLAVGILEETVRVLAGLEYTVVPADDVVPLRRIPSRPRHGLRLQDVRRTG